MSRRCTAIKRTGEPCRCWALPGTEPPRCIYHVESIPESSTGHRWEAQPIDQDRQIKIIEQVIRNVRRAKIPVLEKSRELRALIAQLNELKAQAKDTKEPDWKEKVNAWKKTSSQP